MQDNIYLSENERVKIVLDFLKKSKKIRNHQQFIEEIGSNKSIISRIINKKLKVSNNLLYKIKEKYPELSLNWLLTGEGEMLKQSVDNSWNNISITQRDNNTNNINQEREALIKHLRDEVEYLREQNKKLMDLLTKE